jgi:TRAP-type C4-dicarboxylate transport system substrate-binding protein
MRRTLQSLFCAALLAGAPMAAQAGDKWDMPTPYPDGNFHTQNVKQFADDVKKLSDGKLELVVHSGASLFKMPEIKRAVRSGQAPIGEILLSAYGNDNPIFEVDGIPFLAAGYDNAQKLWDAQRPILSDILAEEGLMVLYAVPWPGQALYSKSEVGSLADMKGVKFRAYNAATSRLAELMGAVPTTVQYSEVPQAFATGVVTAMLTSATTGVDVQSWDFLQYHYTTDAMHPKNAVLVNRAAFEGLDKDVQDAVMKAAAKAESRGWKMSMESAAAATQALQDNGMDVVPPSETLAGELKDVGATMTEEWLAKAGDNGKTLVEAYRAN